MNLFDIKLDLRLGGFSPMNARSLAWASAAAYDTASISNAHSDAQALVVERDSYTIIAFRGTSSLRDWMTDADFSREHLPNSEHRAIEVHDGIYDSLDSIFEKCYLAARRAKENDSPIFITGHSLGGALAMLFAYLLARQSNPTGIAGIYTYGSPRLGNRAFCDHYNALLKTVTFNLVNACDPVPMLPPLLAGYRDCGTEIFLPRAGGFIADPFIGSELGNDLLGMFAAWRSGQLAFLPNHFINRYEDRLALI